MANPNEYLFDVNTPVGFRVHVTRAYWEFLITNKHPIMSNHLQDVINALQQPNEVRQSRKDDSVYLFYSLKETKRWVCAVSKRTDAIGFLITAYVTDSVKEGVKIWPK